MAAWLCAAADALASAIIAPECAACGRPLDSALAGPVCGGCWAGIRAFTPPVCDGCGEALASWRAAGAGGWPSQGAPRCLSCRRVGRHVDRARAVGAYDDRLREIIHAFKYEKRRTLAAGLGALMRRQGADLIAGADLAVPVPLHWSRRLNRGFNQAELLARALGLPVCRALRRRRYTPSQVELPADARRVNVKDAFALTQGAWPLKGARPLSLRPLSGATVVLVDDVSTTGATLDACACVLKQAGVREVRALTAARVATPRR